MRNRKILKVDVTYKIADHRKQPTTRKIVTPRLHIDTNALTNELPEHDTVFAHAVVSHMVPLRKDLLSESGHSVLSSSYVLKI